MPRAQKPAAVDPPAAAIALDLAAFPNTPAVYRELRIGQVFASPLNPRRSRSQEGLQGLALSIAQKGLLQPILVRPAPPLELGAERFEIVLGERRWAAAALAQLDGVLDDSDGRVWQLPSDWLLPCRVRQCGDDELVVLAAVENLDREDMTPLDEAELFQALRPRVKPEEGERREAAIARLLHIGERTIFRRLALARLAPEIKDALRAGELKLGQAEAFALGEHDAQRRLLKAMRRTDMGYHAATEPGDIRGIMTSDRIPLDAALFDPALARVDVDFDSGAKWFRDPAEFSRLQRVAIEAKAAELREQWPWVEVLADPPHDAYEEWGVKKTDKEAGAVIAVHTRRNHRVKIHAPALLKATVKRREAEREAASRRQRGEPEPAAAKPRSPLNEAQVARLHEVKTQALRRAIIARTTHDGRVPLALACLGLIGFHEIRDLAERGHFYDRMLPAMTPPVEAGQRQHLLQTAALDLPDQFKKLDRATGSGGYGEAAAAWFGALMALPADDLAALFAHLVAERVGSWVYTGIHQGERLGDSPLAVAIAQYTGAEAYLPELWHPDRDWFAAYDKDRLWRIAQFQLREPHANRMKKGELVALMAKMPRKFWTAFLFPECRFQSEEAAAAAIAGALPQPAAPEEAP